MLGVAPALASWRTDSPGQVRSAGFLAEIDSAIAERLRVTPDPLALRLDIGLADSVPLLAHSDLDNYRPTVDAAVMSFASTTLVALP